MGRITHYFSTFIRNSHLAPSAAFTPLTSPRPAEPWHYELADDLASAKRAVVLWQLSYMPAYFYDIVHDLFQEHPVIAAKWMRVSCVMGAHQQGSFQNFLFHYATFQNRTLAQNLMHTHLVSLPFLRRVFTWFRLGKLLQSDAHLQLPSLLFHTLAQIFLLIALATFLYAFPPSGLLLSSTITEARVVEWIPFFFAGLSALVLGFFSYSLTKVLSPLLIPKQAKESILASHCGVLPIDFYAFCIAIGSPLSLPAYTQDTLKSVANLIVIDPVYLSAHENVLTERAYVSIIECLQDLAEWLDDAPYFDIESAAFAPLSEKRLSSLSSGWSTIDVERAVYWYAKEVVPSWDEDYLLSRDTHQTLTALVLPDIKTASSYPLEHPHSSVKRL